MPNILQPDKNSRDNMLLFLDTIQDENLRSLLKANLGVVLEIGAQGTGKASDSRAGFYEAMNALVGQMMDESK
jgi:hypothetical protein